MTPAQRVHEDHAQRISWAISHALLTYPRDFDTATIRPTIEQAVRQTAGPCPCTTCQRTDQ